MPGKLHTPSAEAPVWVGSSEVPSGRGPSLEEEEELWGWSRGRVLQVQAGRDRYVWDGDRGDGSWYH